MEIDRNCIATFDLDIHSLSVAKIGSGSGTVTSDPEGIDCGPDCDALFNHGTSVTLTPIADPGSLFISWTGDSDCADGQVTADGPMTCTANFEDVGDVIFLDGFESGDTSAW